MNTYLGASSYLAPVDVDEALVKSAKVVYLEGYMWDRPAAKEAFQKAGEIARAANRRVALTLSDSFCVDRFRGEFLDLMRSGTVDTIFANTDEILSLYQTPHFNEALDSLRSEGVLGIVTRSENGCIIVDDAETWKVPAFPIAKLIDTTGAGDMFAAGFLAGLARGRDMTACGRLGVMAAAEIIQHLGARPNVSLAELARENGLTV
jgi:adenosine kinase